MPSIFPVTLQVSVGMKIDEEVFGEAEYGHLLIYIENMVRYLKSKTRGIREELMPKWVRIYRGVPAQEVADWPWPGASNLILQVAATHADELLSRVMSIYQNDLYVAQLLGDFDDDKTDEKGDNIGGEDQREALEKLISDLAFEPNELDLYRVEETGYSSTIRYGTGIFKFPWEYVVEKQPIYVGGGTSEGSIGHYQWKDLVKRDGPHPEVVPLNDWMIDPKYPNLENADFVAHTLHLTRVQLKKWLKHPDVYNKEAVEKVLNNPQPASTYRQQVEEQKLMNVGGDSDLFDNFDIEEAWFTYNKDGVNISLIAYYHESTNTVIGIIFNQYPDNMKAFEDAKLAYDDDTYYGYGFCEMLEAYQREVSTTHNWRINNRHFATTGVGRINKNSKLSSIVRLFPGVLIPADEGEIEALNFGANAMAMTTEDEQLTLSLAKERSGVDPAIGGAGGGVVNQKRGIYSAQGTSIVMQQQNNRNNLRMSDMRSCHVRIGRKLLMMYAHFGLGDKIRKYGDKTELIRRALENYKNKKLGLVIKAATASVNREMEKQNDVLLSATLERLYAGDAQMVQSITTQGISPELRDLYVEQLKAKNYLMKHILRNFGHEDAARLVPVPAFLKKEREQNGGNSQGSIQQPQQNSGMVPIGTGASISQIPLGTE